MAAQPSSPVSSLSEASLYAQWLGESGAAVLWLDPVACVAAASPGARALAGVALDPGTPLVRCLASRYASRAQRLLIRLWLEAEHHPVAMVVPVQWRDAHSDTHRQTLELNATVVRAGNSRLLALQLRDVSHEYHDKRLVRQFLAMFATTQGSDRRQSGLEQAVRQSSFLCALANESSSVLAVCDEDSKVRYITPSIRELLGYEPMECFDRVGNWFVLPEDRDSTRATYLRAVASGDGHREHYQCRARHAKGEVRALSVDVVNCMHTRPILGMVLTLRDITAERRVTEALEQSERRFSALMEHANDLVTVLDQDGVMLYVSPGVHRQIGYQPGELQGRNLIEIIPVKDRERVQRGINNLVAGGNDINLLPVRHRLLCKDGGLRMFSSVGRNRLADPAIGGMIVNSRDISVEVEESEQRERESARYARYREQLIELAVQRKLEWPDSLHRLLESAVKTLEVSEASFWRLLSDPQRLECEAHFEVSSGLHPELIGKTINATDHPAYFTWLAENRPVVAEATKAHPALVTLSLAPMMAQVLSSMDVPVWVDGKMMGMVCFDAWQPRKWTSDDESFATHLASLLALAVESAMLREAEKRIERLAWLDSLTGLPNRNLLRERLIKVLESATRRGNRMAVMLLDLDRFKEVNDTYGHHVGDALLKNAAQVLQKAVDKDGWVARLGGDEFVVIVPRFEHRDELARMAGRISDHLAQTEVPKGIDFSVTSSIGVAVFPEHGRSISALLKHADAAMYQAKAGGRATFQFYNAFRHNVESREQRIAKQLQRAMDQNELLLHFQPQVLIETRQPSGLEALVRWQHPERGLLYPEAFLSAIEEFGLAETLTRYVTRTACRQIAKWRARGLAVPPVSINITGREFCDLRLPNIIRQALAEHELPANTLVIEVTEGSLVHDNEVAIEVFKSLAMTGVHISLDDFGMGYSSLNYLKRLPLDSIKIDRSFIENLPADADSAAITQAIVSMARHLNLGIVAEGVERVAQAEFLLKLGCRHAQGFLYSPALDVAGIEAYLATRAGVMS